MAEETAPVPSPRRFSFAHLLLLVPWVALVIDAWAPDPRQLLPLAHPRR